MVMRKKDGVFRKSRTSSKKVSKTDDNVQLHQVFAKLAYKKDKERGMVLDNPDYKYNPQYSTREHAVFSNPTSNKTVIAYRGTDFADKRRWHKDVVSDTLIMFGGRGLDPRHKRGVRAYDRVKAAFPDHDVSVTGHSLGGSIAHHVAKNRNSVSKDSTAFSRGTGPAELLERKSNKILDMTNRADPISFFARAQNTLQNKPQVVEHGGKGLRGVHRIKVPSPMSGEEATVGYA
mmetsp:Transcript_55781/g.81525  ORF Transcript_55781/g.81525 Transcript_55781/m.81525 type:complete len:233 (+) Transcript_55781:631-1329(+)